MAMDNLGAATQTDTLISTLDLIHKPDVYNKLVGRFPKQRSLDWLEKMGRWQPITNKTFKHHEENKLVDMILIASKATASSAAVTVTLDTTSVYTVSGTYYSSPRLYDRVEFANGAQGIVTAVSKPTGSGTHTMTITRGSTDYDMDAACIAGDYITLMSYAGYEGTSGSGESLIPTTTVFSNQTQIFYDSHEVTTTEEGNLGYLEFTYPAGHPKAGQTGTAYVIKAEADLVDRFQVKREMGLFTNDTASLSSGGNLLETTRGFLPHLNRYANQMDYISQPTMSTFDQMVAIINKNYGCFDYTVLYGLNFGLGIKNWAVDLMKNGSMVYNSSTGQQMDAVKLGFKTLGYSTGHNFNLMPMPILNHADTTGAPGRKYPDLFIAMPNDKVKDTVTTEMMDAFAIRYNKPRGGGSINGAVRVWETGGAAPTPTGNDLKRRINISSEEGPQIYGAKRFIYGAKKANS